MEKEDTPSRTGHRLPRIVLWPIGAVLRTRNPRDTVDRLFDSRHVNDLRLIAATVFVISAVVFVVAMTVAVAACIDVWTSQAHASRAQFIIFLASNGGRPLVTVFGPTLLLLGACFTWAYQVGSARLGVVDLFACEIDTLCRVVTVTGLVDRLVAGFKADVPQPTPPQGDDKNERTPFSSQENYFPILDSNARDLQSLEADVVTNITAFYTYMKTVRDTFRKLADTNGGDRRREELKNLLYMLYLALESGRKAMDDLVEFEPTHTERTMVILLSELAAYEFLRDQYRTRGELHHRRLILRGPVYSDLKDRLRKRIARKRERVPVIADAAARNLGYEDSQWSAALQSLPLLIESFNELEARFPLECTVAEE